MKGKNSMLVHEGKILGSFIRKQCYFQNKIISFKPDFCNKTLYPI